MSKGLKLDYETADRIAVLVMKDHLAYLEEEVRLYMEDSKHMHPDDYVENTKKLIPSLKTLIAYFGG